MSGGRIPFATFSCSPSGTVRLLPVDVPTPSLEFAIIPIVGLILNPVTLVAYFFFGRYSALSARLPAR